MYKHYVPIFIDIRRMTVRVSRLNLYDT